MTAVQRRRRYVLPDRPQDFPRSSACTGGTVRNQNSGDRRLISLQDGPLSHGIGMSHRPESLLDVIERGGPLADLFRRASADVRAALGDRLAGGVQSGIVAALMGDARARLDKGVEASPLKLLRQCGAGCSACCHTVSADVTPLEALLVAEHLHEHVSAPRLVNIRARLRANAARRAAMTAEERSSTRLRCGLLSDEGLCQAYAARPLVCAGVFSLSRDACESAASNPELAAQKVPLDRPAKAWTMGVSGGLQRALVDAGLDGNLYELNSVVLCAVETPDVAARWLRGEDVFADCVCTDAHSPPRRLPPKIRVDAAHPAPAPLAKGVRRATLRASKRDDVA
jgi:Fe-S-cluster containining protein